MNFQNRLLKLFFGFISMTFTINLNSQLVEVTNFGNNFGNLKMYQFIPSNPQLNAPLVVVMHGCMQNATTFANETGWNTLAEQYGFYVLYPEQKSINNYYKIKMNVVDQTL